MQRSVYLGYKCRLRLYRIRTILNITGTVALWTNGLQHKLIELRFKRSLSLWNIFITIYLFIYLFIYFILILRTFNKTSTGRPGKGKSIFLNCHQKRCAYQNSGISVVYNKTINWIQFWNYRSTPKKILNWGKRSSSLYKEVELNGIMTGQLTYYTKINWR